MISQLRSRAGLATGTALLLVLALPGCSKPETTSAELAPHPSTPVVVVAPRAMTFRQTLAVAGTVAARQQALVSARIPGTLDKVFVDEGDLVVQGETRLFQTDSLKLRKAVEIASRQLAVVECMVRERQANREKVQAAFHKSEIDFKRYSELFATDQAVTRNELEEKQSDYLQQQAELKHAGVMVELAERQYDQANSQLAIAQKDLSDALVIAPISGVVRQRFQESGEMAGPGAPVLKIENLTELEICAALPGESYPLVIVGQTVAQVQVNGIDLTTLPIAYKSPALDERFRSYEVKCRIKNAPPGVVPGGLARLQVVLRQRDGLGVPKESVLQRAGADVVFTVHDQTARQVAVTQGIVDDGWVELLAPQLTAADQVVRMGQVLLDDQARVAVLGTGSVAAPAATPPPATVATETVQ